MCDGLTEPCSVMDGFGAAIVGTRSSVSSDMIAAIKIMSDTIGFWADCTKGHEFFK